RTRLQRPREREDPHRRQLDRVDHPRPLTAPARSDSMRAMEAVATRTGSPLATFFHISRFHIICIASVTAVAFGWLLTDRLAWLPAAFCALDWFLVNLMNRIADLREDRLNGIAGTDFVDRNSRALTYGSIALLVGSFPLGALL